MAEHEHIMTLRQGISGWNAWREANPGVIPDLSSVDLGGHELRRANLTGVVLKGANLQGADLAEAILIGANLAGADLSGTVLMRADLTRASLVGSELADAKLFGASLRSANLRNASLVRANLELADLRGADLSYANLDSAHVNGVRFNRRATYLGAQVATVIGSPRFRRFAQDQEYLEELRAPRFHLYLDMSARKFILTMGRVKYLIWLVVADCGRSIMLWSGWSVIMILAFAGRYYYLGPDAIIVSKLPWNFWSLLYYSVVTFTTLGFGDILPATNGAANWVMAEVIAGYVMLGGLISILATKLARRS